MKIYCLAAMMLLPVVCPAQIGGRTSADGPFVLEDAEDGDLFVDSLGRDWIPDYVAGKDPALQSIVLADTGLTLAQDQSTSGSLRFRIPSSYRYIDSSFGVPMPGIVGASTLDAPGDISSFEKLEFLIRYSPEFTNQQFQVILECYPGAPYQKLFWNYALPPGQQFERVTIPLRSPSLIEGAGVPNVDELLSRTRYLALYFLCGDLKAHHLGGPY